MPYGPKDLEKFNRGRVPEKMVFVKIATKASEEIAVSYCDITGIPLRSVHNDLVRDYYQGDLKVDVPGPMGIQRYESTKFPFPWGKVYMHQASKFDGPCLDAFVLGTSVANKGWGVMLYDLLLQLAGKNGLTSDRALVSSDASKVWIKYHEDRGDVEKQPLDPIPDEKSTGKLTPDDPTDDCVSAHIENSNWNTDILDPEKGPRMMRAVNHVYYGTNIRVKEELESLDLLWRPGMSKAIKTTKPHHDEIYENLKRLYLSLLTEKK